MFEVASHFPQIASAFCHLPSMLAQDAPDTFDRGELVSLVTVACLFGGPVVVGALWVGAHFWSRAMMHARDLELKHRLLDAGMTADEIERLINAGRNSEAEKH